MINRNLISPWIRRFLLEYLITERNLARSTQLSYRDTLAALIGYLAQKTRKRADLLELTDFSRARIVQFLEHLKHSSSCGPRTLNRHLAALHSFARYIGAYAPEHLECSGTILSIAFKKFVRPTIGYLEKPEIDALLAAPDRRTAQGERDHLLLLFLYNTGARASEVAQVSVADLQLPDESDGRTAFVTLNGKGSKLRLCPLWVESAQLLRCTIAQRSPKERVFLNRCGRPLTRYGIHATVRRYGAKVARQLSGLSSKRVSPHILRHTCATHLLQNGVDLNTIRAWLGHVSLDTTNIYAQINVKMKADALAKLEPPTKARRRKLSSDLMQFLQSL